MTDLFTCVLCPNSCEMEAEHEGRSFLSCRGNLCPRGEAYARQEIADPRRTISSSVIVEGGEMPLVSVRLTSPVPRDRIFDVMEVIRSLRVCAPVHLGQVLKADILGLGSDLIATRTVSSI